MILCICLYKSQGQRSKYFLNKGIQCFISEIDPKELGAFIYSIFCSIYIVLVILPSCDMTVFLKTPSGKTAGNLNLKRYLNNVLGRNK